jgi:ubiquinone/menaquinone biosynthesis C-methylase UbiE
VTDLNPHGEQMADESMVRNLDAQARAIWPQEAKFFERYKIARNGYILDAGCGTGEITSRLASLFADAHVTGVDIIDAHLELARSRYVKFGPRVAFEHRSIFELGFADDEFDLTVCRHVLQSIPHPERAIAELARVTRAGGYLHLLPEDYGMLHFQNRYAPNPVDFWTRVPAEFGKATETNNHIGRDTFTLLRELGFLDITIDYVVVDTVRTDRETFASIMQAWRDGYSEAIGQRTSVSAADARRYFDASIENIRDPDGYAVWMVPIVAARVPA